MRHKGIELYVGYIKKARVGMSHLDEILTVGLQHSPWGCPESRVHPTPTLGEDVWVKRDDELSFGISGSKLRKFCSLIHYLKDGAYDYAFLTGGVYSNHLPGIVQVLNEQKMKFQIWLRKDQKSREAIANFALLQLLTEPSCFRWLDQSEWENMSSLMQKESVHLRSLGRKVFLIKEGAEQYESLPGAMSAALDIMRNEKTLSEKREQTFRFSTIYVDAGTGLSAIGLILGLSLQDHPRRVVVIGMADSEDVFFSRYQKYKKQLTDNFGFMLQDQHIDILYRRPPTAKSFGSTNARIFDKIRNLARKEGILVDPVYGAKLLLSLDQERVELPSFKTFSNDKHEDLSLWIHSGGSFSLTGFWRQLLKS